MADSAVASDAPAPATPAKKPKASAGAAKKPKAKPTHPKTSEMVNNAIKELKERSGSSLQAIKKYIAAHYKVDAEKLAPFIRKYLKSAVESGALIQTKGKGASGSFKLESKSAAKKPAAAASAAGKAKKAAAPAKAKKAKAAAASPKKKAAAASPTKSKSAAAAKKKPAAAAIAAISGSV
ncbi:histone H1B-like [Macadamia integrifolia]|uniref:histone H1B-like n=1 Tax=Macadamia integrifolia TaxID=60698 RepID=UPI001C4F299E|nr:histone H1B-like [Macadamia integrifolia]